MKTLPLALALFLAPAVALAQEAPPADDAFDLDQAFYRAFYAENGLRDFEKAAEAYAKVAELAGKSGRKDLVEKSLLGRARCLGTMGKADLRKQVLEALLAAAPENAEAKAMMAVGGQGASPEGLESRIDELAGWLENNPNETIVKELRLAGDRAVPIVARSLRKRDLGAVERASLFLARFATPSSRAALLEALRDSEVVYPAAVAEAICRPIFIHGGRPFEDADLPLLEAVAGMPEAGLRHAVLNRLDEDSRRPASIAPLVLRLARDPDLMVRVATLAVRWPPAILRALEPALRASLSAQDPQERAAAAKATKADGDLLRSLQSEVRALLKDESSWVRQAAYGTLADRDGLTQEDLAVLLDDSDGWIVSRAAEKLAASVPWGERTAAAVRMAVGKAIRIEVPEESIWPVVNLSQVQTSPGGFTPEEWTDLFAATWSPGFRWGAVASQNLRENLLNILNNHLARAGEGVETGRWIHRGVKGVASGDGLVQWIEHWNGRVGTVGKDAWLAACSHADARVRMLAYGALVRSQTWSEAGRSVVHPLTVAGAFEAVFPRLAEDLAANDEALRDSALSVATLAIDPSLAGSLRRLHERASGGVRARLLEVLVKAAGKEALDAVRGDLTSKDPEVRSEALGRLVISLGVEEYREIEAYLAGVGTMDEVAGLWNQWDPSPSVELLHAFLDGVPPERISEIVLYAARHLPAAQRRPHLEAAIRSKSPGTRRAAAYTAATWRSVESVSLLSTLLDDTENEVREAAKYALQELKTYVELKTSAARIGKGGEESTFRTAEELLASEDPVKRKGAVLALAALGDKAAIPLLLKALDDKDASVREAALAALERLGGRPAAEEKR